MAEQKTRGKATKAPAKSKETEAPKAAAPAPTNTDESTLMVVIRIRGAPGMRREILNTLKMLNLHKVNHATLLYTTPVVKGMIHKVKDYVAYGPVDSKTLQTLVQKRGRVTGNLILTDEWVRANSDYDGIANYLDNLIKGKTTIRGVKGFKPIFRLHPPSGGHRGTIKKAFNSGGTLGNWGNEINALVWRMM